MNLYRRTLSGFLEKHTLTTAGDLLTADSIIYCETKDDREMLEGMRLIIGANYTVKWSGNFVYGDQWQWFTYNPRGHF